MKASNCIKKFVGKWVNVVLKTGLKITIRIREILNNMGVSLVKYECIGSRELRTIAKSDIVELYA